MPTIYVLSGPDIGRTHEAGAGAVLGRSPDCEVPVRASSVSRNHARLEREGKKWVLIDLDSSNGVRFEGKRVTRLELHDGILFALGDLELRFRSAVEAGESPPPPAAPPEPARSEHTAEVGEIELEGTEYLEAGHRPPPSVEQTEASPRPLSGAAHERRAAAREKQAARGAVLSGARGVRSGGDADVRETGKAPLRYSNIAERRGFFSADLGQYPWWVRLFAGLLALALFVALFWVAFRGAGFLRDRAEGESAVEVPEEESP